MGDDVRKAEHVGFEPLAGADLSGLCSNGDN